MLIKHLSLCATGEDAGAGASSYVLRETDAKGMIRAEVKVLRGDPHLVGDIIDSLPFVHRYTSSVIAFAPEDQPTDKQIYAVVDDHIKLSSAGLEPDRFAVCAVLHREDNGGCHVHMLSARVDLKTGLSFNPAPPGHQYEFDQIVHHHNYLYGWARPDDPERARTHSKGHLHYKNAAQLKLGLAVEVNKKETIHDTIEQNVKLGKIKNRADVRAYLAELGEITRENDKTISVLVEGEKRAYKFKGSIYKADFDGKIIEKPPEPKPPRDMVADVKKAIAARKKFDECCQKRAEFNQLKYRDKSKEINGLVKNEHLEKDRQRRNKTNRKPNNLGGNVLPRLSGKRLAYHGSQAAQGILSADVVLDRRTDYRLRRNEPPSGGGIENDRRIGDDVIRSLDKADRASRGIDTASASIDKASRGIDTASRGLDALGTAGESLRTAAKERISNVQKRISIVRIYAMNCKDELNRFKSEINLSAYLADQGYQIDKRKSCASYAVMRKGEEKLVITRATDGHYVYTDAHNDRDCGSIIDYIQHRRSLNIGQVRKELRPWIGTDRQPAIENYQAKIKKSPADYVRIATSWSNAGEVKNFAYLESRGIEQSTVKAYSDRIKQSSNGTLMFSHLDPHSPISGYEFKGQDYTGFSAGGRKGLFIAGRSEFKNIKRLVITETALDALSYAQIDGCKKEVAYISTGGNPSDKQITQLEGLLSHYGFAVVLAQDNDKGGHEQAEKLRSRLQNLCPSEITRHVPLEAKDWNQELQDLAKQNCNSPGPRC